MPRRRSAAAAAASPAPPKKKTHRAAGTASEAPDKAVQAEVSLADIEDLWVNPSEASDAACKLLAHYDAHRRALPWRQTLNGPSPSPYAVWVSEIMCQQTQVATVVPYFERWMAAFPSIKHLAEADEEQVNALWAGLGYYSRAKSLLNCAKKLVGEFGGELPKHVDILKELPGIGDYTAGAIASIAFDLPEPAVDGNVIRVVSRLGACALPSGDVKMRKAIGVCVTRLHASIPSRHGDLNQSLMEIGARVCTPQNPTCSDCPLQVFCKGRLQAPTRFPAPKPTKPKPVFPVQCVVLEDAAGSVLISKRPSTGLLKGQNELLCIEQSTLSRSSLAVKLRELGVCNTCAAAAAGKQLEERGRFTHVFSHLRHDMTVWTTSVQSRDCSQCTLIGGVRWTRDLRSSGLTSAMIKSLRMVGR